jgi:hypothetical protein
MVLVIVLVLIALLTLTVTNLMRDGLLLEKVVSAQKAAELVHQSAWSALDLIEKDLLLGPAAILGAPLLMATSADWHCLGSGGVPALQPCGMASSGWYAGTANWTGMPVLAEVRVVPVGTLSELIGGQAQIWQHVRIEARSWLQVGSMRRFEVLKVRHCRWPLP